MQGFPQGTDCKETIMPPPQGPRLARVSARPPPPSFTQHGSLYGPRPRPCPRFSETSSQRFQRSAPPGLISSGRASCIQAVDARRCRRALVYGSACGKTEGTVDVLAQGAVSGAASSNSSVWRQRETPALCSPSLCWPEHRCFVCFSSVGRRLRKVRKSSSEASAASLLVRALVEALLSLTNF